MIGKVHSIQTLGTLDGPGVRYVVFLQGCPLRCGCCHNPDAWDFGNGNDYTEEQIVDNVLKYKEYFGEQGGVTISGGEPLVQAEFVREVFSLCKQKGINTCLDTSGAIFNQAVKDALEFTDRVLLDIKYTNQEYYKEFVGCEMQAVINFLEYLNSKKIKTTIRQVIIPTLNDSENSVLELKNLVKRYACVDKIELLPFKKICKTKYDNMGLEFRFDHFSTPDKAKMDKLNALINN